MKIVEYDRGDFSIGRSINSFVDQASPLLCETNLLTKHFSYLASQLLFCKWRMKSYMLSRDSRVDQNEEAKTYDPCKNSTTCLHETIHKQ